jgi:hypothetical protein
MDTLKRIISIVTVFALVGMIIPASQANALTAAELQAQIAALQAQLTELTKQLSEVEGTTPAKVTGCSIASFTRNLAQKSTGDDVKCLQVILNSDTDTKITETGAGSLGNETTYFGALTKAAVVKFQTKYASAILASYGLTTGTGYVGATTRAKLNEMLGAGVVSTTPTTTTTPAITTGGLTVALASDNPAAGNFPAGAGQVAFLKLNFTAGAADAVVTAMNVYRTGLSSDNDISNVYLMDGSNVLATNLGLSSGKANFSASTGLFTVKAGTSKVVTVAADIASGGTTSHTFTFGVNGTADITTTATVNGAFPITGNSFAAVSVSNPALATLTVANITTGTSVNGGTTGFLAGQFSLLSANSAVSVKSIKLTETGTINAAADLANIKLMNGATQVGATVANLNADGTVIFNLSSNPLQITSGATINLSVYADVVGGVSRNFRFTIQRAYDIIATDMTYYVGATVSASSFPVNASQVSVNAGSLVVSKNSSSPVNYIAAGATNATLSSFNFAASGEAVRVTALTYSIGGYTSGSENTVWNNLKLVDDQGVQIGTVLTSGINVGTSKSQALTNLNYIIPANTTRVLSIKADIVSSYAGNVVGSITSGAAQGYTSLSSIAIGSYAGNALSSSVIPFSAAINNAVGAITTVSGASNVKVGSFVLSAGAAEGINVSSITILSGGAVATQYQNLVVKQGATQIGTTQATLGNTTSYTFSPSSPIAIATGGQVVIDVFADTISSVTSPAAVVVLLSGSQGTGASTNVSRTATGVPATGQTVTVNAAGALTTALASPAVVTQQVSMEVATVKLGSFKLSADNNENIDVTSLVVVSTSTRAQDIVNLKLMSGTTQYGSTVSGVSAANANTTFTLATPLSVPQNSYVVLDVIANINSSTNGAVSADTTTVGLGTVNYQGALSKASASVIAQVASGATFTIYKTSMAPAIGPAFTAPAGLADGSIVSQFNITAGTAGDVILKTISISQSGSLIQSSSSVALNVYGSDAPTTLLGTVTAATSTNTYVVTLNSSTGWTVAKGTTQYLIVKANLGSAANLVTTTGTKSYQINVQAAGWNDSVTNAIPINPTVITPINGQVISFTF